MQNDNLEQQLNQLKNPEPVNGVFRENLRKRLINDYQSSIDNDQLDTNANSMNRKLKIENGQLSRVKPFWKFSFGMIFASIAFIFCLSSVTAYVAIPEVQEKVNNVVGVTPKEKVKINSNPDGAKVYINEEYYGETPLITKLEDGNYKLKLVKENFEEIEEMIDIKKNEDSEINFELKSLDPYFNWLEFEGMNSRLKFKYPSNFEIEKNEENLVTISSQNMEIEFIYGSFSMFKLPKVENVITLQGQSVILFVDPQGSYTGGRLEISDEPGSGLLVQFNFAELQEKDREIYKEIMQILDSVSFNKIGEDKSPVSYPKGN